MFETIVAVLDPIGGHLAINLATAAAAGLAVVGLARLVRAWDHPNGDLVGLAFLASPVVLIAATSTGDFIWAAMFLVWGCCTTCAVAAWSRGAVLVARSAAACRQSSSPAFLIADGWDPTNRRRSVPRSSWPRRWRC